MVRRHDTRQARLKSLLLEEKRTLWNELRIELFDKLGKELNKPYDIPMDTGERSVLDLLEDTGLAITDIRSEKLTLLDNALSKLDTGSYGVCDDCGREIDEARLQISPYAACCAACQQQRERSGKTAARY